MRTGRLVGREEGLLKMDLSNFPEVFNADIDRDTQNKIADIEKKYDEQIAALKAKLSCNKETKTSDADDKAPSGNQAGSASSNSQSPAGGPGPVPTGNPSAAPNRPAGGDLLSQLKAGGVNLPNGNRPSSPAANPSNNRPNGNQPPMGNRPNGNMPSNRPGPGGMPQGRGGNNQNKPDLFDKATDKIKERADEQKKKNPVAFYIVMTGIVLGGLAALVRANSLMDTHDIKLIAISSLIVFVIIALIPIVGLILFKIFKKFFVKYRDEKIEDEIADLELEKDNEIKAVKEAANNQKNEYAMQFNSAVQERMQVLATFPQIQEITNELSTNISYFIDSADRSNGVKTISVSAVFKVYNDKIAYPSGEYIFVEHRVANLATNFDQAALAWAVEGVLRMFMMSKYPNDIQGIRIGHMYRKDNENGKWAAVINVDYNVPNSNYVELRAW